MTARRLERRGGTSGSSPRLVASDQHDGSAIGIKGEQHSDAPMDSQLFQGVDARGFDAVDARPPENGTNLGHASNCRSYPSCALGVDPVTALLLNMDTQDS